MKPALVLLVLITAALLGAGAPRLPVAPETHVGEAARFHCGNHPVSHFAENTADVKRKSEEHGCTDWKAVTLKSIRAAVVALPNGEAVAGAQWELFDADGRPVAQGITAADGTIAGELPEGAGLRAVISLLGYSATSVVLRADPTGPIRITVGGGRP